MCADLLGDMGSSSTTSSSKTTPVTSGFGFVTSSNSSSSSTSFSNNATTSAPASNVAPSASGFSFFSGSSGLQAPAPAPVASSSSFGFMSSTTSPNNNMFSGLSSSTPLAPPSSTIDDLFAFGGGGSVSTTTRDASGSLGDALAGLGLGEMQNASLNPLGSSSSSSSSKAGMQPSSSSSSSSSSNEVFAGYNAMTDFSKLSAGQIKKYLEYKKVDYKSCVEKSEFVALAMKTASSSFSSPSSSSSSSSSWKTQTKAASIMEIGLPNAFEATGFDQLAPDAAKSVEHDRLYRAATTAVATDMASFFQAASKIKLGQLSISSIPLSKFSVRAPAAVLNPIIREVPQSYMRETVTELTVSATANDQPGSSSSGSTTTTTIIVASPGSALSQKALLPFLGQQIVGFRRVYEIPLRLDTSAKEILSSVVSAGKSIGLDAVHTTSKSVVLMQRVTVPASAYSAFTSTTSVTGTNGGAKTPVVIYPGKGDAFTEGAAGSGVGGLGSWLHRGTQTYVNCLCVLTGTNSSGDRVAMVVSSRFLPDTTIVQQQQQQQPQQGTVAGATTGTAATVVVAPTAPELNSRYGRVVTKEKMGSGSSSKQTSSSSSSSDPMAMLGLSELSSAGSGVICALVNKRSSPRYSYRTSKTAIKSAALRDRAHSRGKSAGNSGAENSNDDDDPFGMSNSLKTKTIKQGSGGDNHNSEDDDDEDDLGTLSKSAASALAAAEREVMFVPPLHANVSSSARHGPGVDTPADITTSSSYSSSGASANAAAGASSSATSCTEDEEAMNTEDDSLGAQESFDDGSDIITSSSGVLPDWGSLRVSFLDADTRVSKSTGAGTAAAALSSAAAGLKAAAAAAATANSSEIMSLSGAKSSQEGVGSTVGPPTFTLPEVEDELVALTCAFAAALRSERVLAESMWLDAIESAKIAIATKRGETLQPNWKNSTAVTSSRFIVHPDTVTAVTAAHRAAGEARLYKAANPYETRARQDDTIAAGISKALAPTFTVAKLTPTADTSLPSLTSLPLTIERGGVVDDSDLREAAAVISSSSSSSSQSPLLFPPAPSKLTATDDTLRELYIKAYRTTRRIARAYTCISQVKEQEIDEEMRARLERKRTHVALRIGQAFYTTLLHVSQLHYHEGRRGPAPTLPLEMKADPAKVLVAGTLTFGIQDEPPIYYGQATAYKQLGEVAVTVRRLLFGANMLGFRTLKNIPFDAIVAVHRSYTTLMVDNTLTITYTDDDKISAAAAKRVKEEGKAAAAALLKKDSGSSSNSKATTTTTTTTITGNNNSTNIDDLFGGLGIVSGGSSSSSSSNVGIPNSSSPPKAPVASANLSVDDAFGGLCEIDGNETSSATVLPSSFGMMTNLSNSSGTSTSASKASTATATTSSSTSRQNTTSSSKPAQVAATGSDLIAVPGLSEGLTAEDMMVFLQAGGATDTLSQIHITPVGNERDLLFYLLQLLRQVSTRPHLKQFAFPALPGGSTGTGGGGGSSSGSSSSNNGAAGSASSSSAGGGANAAAVAAADLPKISATDYYEWLVSNAGRPTTPPPIPIMLWGNTSSSSSSLLLGGSSSSSSSSSFARNNVRKVAANSAPAASGLEDLFSMMMPSASVEVTAPQAPLVEVTAAEATSTKILKADDEEVVAAAIDERVSEADATSSSNHGYDDLDSLDTL